MKTRRIKSKLVTNNVDQPLPTPPVDPPNPESLIDFRSIRPFTGRLEEMPNPAAHLEPGMGIEADILRQMRDGLFRSVAIPESLLLREPARLGGFLAPDPATVSATPPAEPERRYPGLAQSRTNIATRPVTITTEMRVEGTRRDPVTNEEYPIDQPVGVHYDESRCREWVHRIDYGIMAMAQLRLAYGLQIDRNSTLSILRFDVLLRIVLPLDYGRLCTVGLRNCISEVARAFGCEELSGVRPFPGGESQEDITVNNNLCDRLVHHIMSRIVAGHWGTF